MFVRAPTPYPTDIKPLTALRFWAALAIVFYHLAIFIAGDGAVLPTPLAQAYLGVDFFFILSGFILAHVYLDAAARGMLKPMAFYARRLARIYPVHLLTLGVAVLPYAAALLGGVPEIISDHMHPRYVFSHALMLHAWGTDDRSMLNVPSWSISAEWFAYLLFPFLAVAILRVRPVVMLALSLLLFGGLYIFVGLLPAGAGLLDSGRILTVRTFDFGIVRIVPEFVMGMALYRFGAAWALRGRPRVLLAAVALVLFGSMILSAPDVVIVPLFAVLIYLVAESARQGDDAYLSRPWMVLMGEASYSLYMTHYLWLHLVFVTVLPLLPGGDGAGVRYMAAALLLPVMLWTALACYRRVEVPWRHKLWSVYSRFFPVR